MEGGEQEIAVILDVERAEVRQDRHGSLLVFRLFGTDDPASLVWIVTV
jgi:hypothetical protein